MSPSSKPTDEGPKRRATRPGTPARAASPDATPEPSGADALDAVRSFLAAANAHEVEVALAHLAPDYRFLESGAESGIDRDGMRTIFEWDAVLDSEALEETMQASGDRVEGEFLERNALYRGLGIEETRCRLVFRVEDGRIAEQVITQLPQDGPSFDEAVTPFLEWLGEEDPDAFEELMPEGEIEFRADLAKRWLALVERWRADRDRNPARPA